jgi:mono/diheme cytochrome c family protein
MTDSTRHSAARAYWKSACVWAVATLATCFVPGTTQAQSEPDVEYNRDIRPILSKNCFACHGADEAKRSKNLRLDQRESAVAELADGAHAIVPESPDDSELLFRISETDPTVRMPPAKFGPPLTPSQVALIRRWIERGAPYAEHWAFVPPIRQP